MSHNIVGFRVKPQSVGQAVVIVVAAGAYRGIQVAENESDFAWRWQLRRMTRRY